MHVAIDATPVVPNRKGIGTVLEGLISATPPASTLGRAVHFIDQSFAEDAHRMWPGRHLESVTIGSSMWWERVSLPMALRKHRTEVLVTFRERTIAPRKTKTVLWLFEVPDHRLKFILEGNESAFRKMVARNAVERLRCVARHVSHFIVSCDFTRQDLIQRYGVSAERISIVYPGVPHGLHDAARRESLANRPSPAGNGRYVLHFATGDRRENSGTALECFASIANQIPRGVRLVLAGVPDFAVARLESRVSELGIADRVTWLGYVPSQDMPALFSQAEVYFDPTLFEGWGLQIVESMACGTPVVTSNAASVPEVVGSAAIMADPLDGPAFSHALVSLVNDEDLRKRFSRAGLAEVGRFSWTAASAALTQVVDRLGA